MSYTDADLVVVIPLLWRTEHIARVYDALLDTVPRAHLVWVVSGDDDAVDNRRVWPHQGPLVDTTGSIVITDWPGGDRGDYGRKINLGYRESREPLIFTAADDVVPRPGWFEACLAQLGDGIGVVGTNDLANPRSIAGTHSTHSLVTREYADRGACIDQDHVIYHEGYWHEYVDDELVQTAMARHAYAHAHDAHVEHFHPIVGPHAGLVPDDRTYRHGRESSLGSRSLYRVRRRLWTQPRQVPGRRR